MLAVAGGFGLAFAPGVAQAQIREQQPAEFPAASFKGKQYVDSKGCVFIRAGIDGNVSWVPRVARDRKTVCGFRPTNTELMAASAPAAGTGAAPVQITLDTAPAAAPAPQRTASVAAPRRAAAPVVVRQTAPQPVIIKPTMVAPSIQVRSTAVPGQGAIACAGASAISQQYLRGSGVRCGPQAAPIVGSSQVAAYAPVPTGTIYGQRASVQPYTGSGAGYGNGVSSTTRIVPKHVAENRRTPDVVSIPEGYRAVWEDDRLNPKRAEQTLAGRAQMGLVWTQTLPRRLVDPRSGRDVTASVPLVYPYTDVTQQQRELGEVTLMQRGGQTVKRIRRNAGAAPLVRAPVYSSRSAPQQIAAPEAAYSGKRYVQIGTFRDAGNAQRAAQNIARMGMPARIGTHRKSGQRYMSVQAGPFGGAQAMQDAMNRLRGAGYRDAFAR
ncbi:MAG: SPOR domain-containing protein [Sulfitobacter sp.]|jgi:hypothetical protein|nr:SPOR domain-containing protein [Sulfitobacter sp.]